MCTIEELEEILYNEPEDKNWEHTFPFTLYYEVFLLEISEELSNYELMKK